MLIKKINESPKIEDPNHKWNSIRMLLKGDGMGFSFHITTIYKNTEIKIHYQNQL